MQSHGIWQSADHLIAGGKSSVRGTTTIQVQGCAVLSKAHDDQNRVIHRLDSFESFGRDVVHMKLFFNVTQLRECCRFCCCVLEFHGDCQMPCLKGVLQRVPVWPAQCSHPYVGNRLCVALQRNIQNRALPLVVLKVFRGVVDVMMQCVHQG